MFASESVYKKKGIRTSLNKTFHMIASTKFAVDRKKNSFILIASHSIHCNPREVNILVLSNDTLIISWCQPVYRLVSLSPPTTAVNPHLSV